MEDREKQDRTVKKKTEADTQREGQTPGGWWAGAPRMEDLAEDSEKDPKNGTEMEPGSRDTNTHHRDPNYLQPQHSLP